MKFSRARTIVAAAVYVVLSIGIVAGFSTGTLCGLGWDDISVLCPLGALLSMISSRTVIPKAVLCILVAAVLVVLLGRAFCGWVCPISLWRRIMDYFSPVKKRQKEQEARAAANRELARGHIEACKGSGTGGGGCSSCSAGKGNSGTHAKLGSRHAVLGGTILASIAFGFPVFCTVCPVGLSFAVVSLVAGLFVLGDLNWSLAFAPAFLIIELVVLKKWCTRFCPISALMSLAARFSRTGRPQIDNAKCLESSKGAACSRCATACSFDVNLRHPEDGELPAYEYARCMECVDACPAQAISIRLVNGKDEEFALVGTDAPDEPGTAA